MKSRYLYCLLFAGVALSASAQRKISIDPMYAFPLGRLNWTYKSSPGIGISYRKETSSKGVRPSFGATISYIQMAPNADSLYFIVDRGGVNGIVLGTISTTKFSMFQLKVNCDYIIPISDSFNFNPGLSAGYLYGKRDYYYTDVFYLTSESSEFIGWGLLSARTGFEVKMGASIKKLVILKMAGLITSISMMTRVAFYLENMTTPVKMILPTLSAQQTMTPGPLTIGTQAMVK